MLLKLTDSVRGVLRHSRLLTVTLIGAGYGGLTSVLDNLSPAHSDLGEGLAGTPMQSVLRVLSTMTGAGWAWAALAVVAGWWLGTRRGGAAAAAVALTAATATYYVMDALLRAEPVLNSGIWLWCAVSLLTGVPLGMVGAQARRPSQLGLLAALTVPIGAATQMAVLPPGLTAVQVATEAVYARRFVWVLSAAAALWILLRHRGKAKPAHRVPSNAVNGSSA